MAFTDKMGKSSVIQYILLAKPEAAITAKSLSTFFINYQFHLKYQESNVLLLQCTVGVRSIESTHLCERKQGKARVVIKLHDI